jgi:hypothetical protein
MSTQNITIDFFSVVMPAGSMGFPAALNKLHSRHAIRLTSDVLVLEHLRHKGTLWEGDVARIRTDEPITRGHATGRMEVIPSGKDEGPFDRTAFLYSEPTRTLVLQRNRQGASASVFARFVQVAAEIDGFVELEPVLNKKAWERLGDLQIISKFHVKVAGLRNARVLQRQGYGVNSVGSFMEQAHAPTLEIVASMARKRRGTLNVRWVKEAAKRFFRVSSQGATTVTSIELSGRDQNFERDVIDLIHERIFDRIAVNRAADKTISQKDRLESLYYAWEKRREEIALLYQEE